MAHEQGKESQRPDREAAPDREHRDPGSADGPDPTQPPPEGPGSPGGLTDFVRRAFAAGFSGFFFTEEALRKAFGDTVPREWVEFASEQSARTRSEVIERLSFEMGRAVETVDWAAVLSALLEGRTLEVRAEIRLGEKSADGTQRLLVDVAKSGDPR